jgi:hypothetical protein
VQSVPNGYTVVTTQQASCNHYERTIKAMANSLDLTTLGLSNEKITELMGAGRARNAYGPKLVTFMESDEAAINPVEVWPIEFQAKQASTLYQGFLTAVKKANLEDQVLVKQNDGNVYLLHKERVAVALGTALGSSSHHKHQR